MLVYGAERATDKAKESTDSLDLSPVDEVQRSKLMAPAGPNPGSGNQCAGGKVQGATTGINLLDEEGVPGDRYDARAKPTRSQFRHTTIHVHHSQLVYDEIDNLLRNT